MINLIGPERKKHILAARRNSIWIRYIFLLLSTAVAIVIILGGASFYFYSQEQTENAKVTANEEKAFTNEYKTQQSAVNTFKKNLKTAKTILDGETYYSAILLDVAKTMPKGSVLSSLRFDATTFQAEQSLEFKTKDVGTALALKKAFEENPPLSSQVRFSSVTKSDESNQEGPASSHPIQVTMFMKLSKPENALGTSTEATP